MIFHNRKIKDNISKTKNESSKCDYSISDIYSFITKNYYFKLLINVSKNTAKKHYNIIFSNSHKKNIIFLNLKEILGMEKDF